MNLFERAKAEHCKLTQGFPDNEYLMELDKLIYVFNKYSFKSIEELDNYLMSITPMIYENGEWRKADE